MAHLGRMSRICSSQSKTAYLGILHSYNQITVNNSRITREGLSICEPFEPLKLFPLQSALYKQLTLQPLAIKEYRLPTAAVLEKVTIPSLYKNSFIEKVMPPFLNIVEKVEPIIKPAVQEPPSCQIVEKHAARLIVIRRKKMKKHKLRKLRKKMRFEWLKIIQKREYKKEKLFQASCMSRVRTAEAFNAVEFVADILRKTKEVPISNFYKGKRLPIPVIKEIMLEEERKKNYREENKYIQLDELKIIIQEEKKKKYRLENKLALTKEI